LSAKAMGHGKRSGETLPLLFKASDTETFHTTFAYSAATDAWQWLMDDEVGGKSTPFARLKLTRKGQ